MLKKVILYGFFLVICLPAATAFSVNNETAMVPEFMQQFSNQVVVTVAQYDQLDIRPVAKQELLFHLQLCTRSTAIIGETIKVAPEKRQEIESLVLVLIQRALDKASPVYAKYKVKMYVTERDQIRLLAKDAKSKELITIGLPSKSVAGLTAADLAEPKIISFEMEMQKWM